MNIEYYEQLMTRMDVQVLFSLWCRMTYQNITENALKKYAFMNPYYVSLSSIILIHVNKAQIVLMYVLYTHVDYGEMNIYE